MSNPLKKTMVFLGLAEEELENEQHEPQPRQAVVDATPAPQPVRTQRATVTPLRRTTPTRQATHQAMNEILTVHPTEYREAAAIAEAFREGVPVIMNLSRMNEAEAKRLIDFASGLSLGLNGKIERVTAKVFLLSPEHIALSGDDHPQSSGETFFVSPN